MLGFNLWLCHPNVFCVGLSETLAFLVPTLFHLQNRDNDSCLA